MLIPLFPARISWRYGFVADTVAGATTTPDATFASVHPAVAGATTAPAATVASVDPVVAGATTAPAATFSSVAPAVAGATTAPAATVAPTALPPVRVGLHSSAKPFCSWRGRLITSAAPGTGLLSTMLLLVACTISQTGRANLFN